LEITTPGVRVQLQEDSPDIFFYYDSTTNGSYYKMTWKGFTEIDERKAPIRYTQFGSNFSYGKPALKKNHLDAFYISVNMTLDIAVEGGGALHLVVSHFFFLNNTMTKFADKEVPIGPSAVQFGLDGDSWPFLRPKNRLLVHFVVATHHVNHTDSSATYDSKRHLFNFQGSSEDVLMIQFAKTCMVNSTEKVPVLVAVEYDNGGLDGSTDPTGDMSLSFHSFHNLHYDAILSVSLRHDWTPFVAVPPSLSKAVLIFLGVAGIVLLVIGTVTAVLKWRRNAQRRFYLHAMSSM